MALAWHATGPMRINVATDIASPAYVAFAYTDNEDLCGFEIEDIQRRFTSNPTGDMTAEIITTGSVCHISFTTTKWDEQIHDDILSVMRSGDTGTTEGAHAEVGALMNTADANGNRRLFGLALTTTRIGEKSYVFPLCTLAAPLQKRDMGNTMLKLIALVEALPDGNGGFYTTSVNA